MIFLKYGRFSFISQCDEITKAQRNGKNLSQDKSANLTHIACIYFIT